MISLLESLGYALLWACALAALRHVSLWITAGHTKGLGLGVTSLLFLSTLTYVTWLWGAVTSLPHPALSFAVGLIIAGLFLRYAFRALPDRAPMSRLESEVVFWMTFSLALGIRLQSPHIDIGEKYADLMILQGALLDTSYPPLDRWLSGYSLNYYYYGQLFFAPLAKVLSIPVEVLFNLLTITVAAYIAELTFDVAKRLGLRRSHALLATAMMLYFGNWHWIESFVYPTRDFFYWWDASRAISNTITEFPFFSFLLGDLHAHYIALPFLSLTLWGFMSLRELFDGRLNVRSVLPQRSHLTFFILVALIVGQNYVMNPWQSPWMFLLGALLLWRTPLRVLSLLVFSVLLFLPFWLSYEKPNTVSGIFTVPEALRSSLWSFTLHWGGFLAGLGTILLASFRTYTLKTLGISLAAGLIVGLLASWALGLVALLVCLVFLGQRQRLSFESACLAALGVFAIVFVEFFSVDRTYGDVYLRLNTVFKFYMVAWWALSLFVPLLASHLGLGWKTFVPVVIASLVYPVLGTQSRIQGHLQGATLDGMAAWNHRFPHERPIIDWLRQNSSPNAVILEATGGGYERFARIATFSGRQTVVGWLNHEQVWRKNGYSLAHERIAAIDALSKNYTPQALHTLLKKHRVDFVMLGQLEREQWSETLRQSIAALPVAFRDGRATLHRVPIDP